MDIKRDIYLQRLIDRKHNGLVKVITGVRRCGKSYLLFNLFYKHLIAAGIDEKHIIKVSFDEPQNKKLMKAEDLCRYLDSMINDDDMHYILLDEVQLLEDFEGVLNRYMKQPNTDIYVTGSNSKFLSTDVITEFRGRGDEVHIMPLSFSEYFPAHGGTFAEAWEDYTLYGGMPNVLKLKTEEQKISYLSGLFSEMYLVDIMERNGLKGVKAIGELIDVLASSSASMVNPRKLENTFTSVTGNKLSQVTISNYLDYLEQAFIVKKAIRYDIKGKRYIGTPSKYYFEDVGLMNARLNFRQTDDTPHVMENIIFNELRYRGFSVDIGSVELSDKNSEGKRKTINAEVDFVANMGNRRYYIQSAFSMPTSEKAYQEKRPLNAIKDSFKKIVVVGDISRPRWDDNGILTIGIETFMTRADSLEL